jgi:RecA-family ATPase
MCIRDSTQIHEEADRRQLHTQLEAAIEATKDRTKTAADIADLVKRQVNSHRAVVRRELENLWLGARSFNHQDPLLPRPWLVGSEADPVIPQGKVAMLAGEGAIGKSTLLVDLALSVAAGKSWLGFPTSPGSVLLVAGEEDQNDIHRRLQTGLAEDWSDEDIETVLDRLVIVPGAGRSLTLMDDRGGPTALCRELIGRLQNPPDEKGWSLIALDPLSRFASGAVEVDNVAATAFIALLEQLLTVPGKPTVLLTHHTSQTARNDGHSRATAARGVTGLTDAVRCVLTLWKTKEPSPRQWNEPVLSFAKQNYGKARGDLKLERCGPRLVVSKTEDQATRSDPKGSASKPRWTEDG